jgi:dolichyl-phosphate beta-glucosyltransferase
LAFLTIVIPAYNEELRLPSTLERIAEYLIAHALDADVIVGDDGSTDQTKAVVASYGARFSFIRLLCNPGNRGKGYAVRHGMLSAQGEWRLFSDADLSTPITELSTLIEAATRADAAVAIGSRAINRKLVHVHQSAFREYAGRGFNVVMRLVTGLDFKDTQCGFKLYSAQAASRIFPRQLLDGFSFDVEDLVIARLQGIKAIEVPVRWSNMEGTKVGFVQAARSFADLVRIRWNSVRGRYA